MKTTLLTFFLAFGILVSAQTKKYTGDYGVQLETEAGEIIEYNLTLNPNGTFLFHSGRKTCATCTKVNAYGKGEWKNEKENLIYFYTDKGTDMNPTYTLNLNNSKARYKSKSPRDKSDRIIKTALVFYDSDISWVKGQELFKKE